MRAARTTRVHDEWVRSRFKTGQDDAAQVEIAANGSGAQDVAESHVQHEGAGIAQAGDLGVDTPARLDPGGDRLGCVPDSDHLV